MKHSSRTFRAVSGLGALLIAAACTTDFMSNIRSASANSAMAAAAAASVPSASPATSATSVASTQHSAITIDNYKFHPAVLTVAKGTTVVWINKDDDVHTIKSKDGPQTLQSRALETGARYGFTFDHPGTYHYICTVHPYMHGVIVVR